MIGSPEDARTRTFVHRSVFKKKKLEELRMMNMTIFNDDKIRKSENNDNCVVWTYKRGNAKEHDQLT